MIELIGYREREAEALNGMIVADSDVVNPEEYVGVRELASEEVKSFVVKRRKAIRRHMRYLKAKTIAERNFLKRKTSKRTHGILQDCPNIGEVIEKFVTDRNIGADAWRRTGVLTFDGNSRVGKVTFARIQEHLESFYQKRFSYGSIVELCVARNRRRKSAKRYRGVARVTCRRARKVFQIKYNPDAHWSAALYRALSKIQYEDGRNILNVNRDDASGFRLDTMSTHKLHKTPMVQGKQALTTYTDYVIKYPSTLQTTSYNFTRTATTPEMCAGVVKAAGVFSKNPAQHVSDIDMLEGTAELATAFINPVTEQQKQIECIRVDGAGDEGPSHEEVQFFWTLRHVNKQNFATLVTTRCSGCSYLNRVELQNGCLALGHANLFIPSTFGESNMDPATGQIHKERFVRNMEKATEVYINRVNGSPCGETSVHLFKGANSSANQDLRLHLLQYLKGTKVQKERLRQNHKVYDHIERIWTIRNNHMITNLPSQYVFHLVCCFKTECTHPICEKHSPSELPVWYNEGPSVSYIPLPIPDPLRPWGAPECVSCGGQCHGHYLKPEEAVELRLGGIPVIR